jgi:hypothetical protein
MLSFVGARLRERKDVMYDAFMDYLGSRNDLSARDSFRAILFFDSKAWSNQCLDKIEDESVEIKPLTMHAISVANLRELVEEIFGNVGLITIDDDD